MDHESRLCQQIMNRVQTGRSHIPKMYIPLHGPFSEEIPWLWPVLIWCRASIDPTRPSASQYSSNGIDEKQIQYLDNIASVWKTIPG